MPAIPKHPIAPAHPTTGPRFSKAPVSRSASPGRALALDPDPPSPQRTRPEARASGILLRRAERPQDTRKPSISNSYPPQRPPSRVQHDRCALPAGRGRTRSDSTTHIGAGEKKHTPTDTPSPGGRPPLALHSGRRHLAGRRCRRNLASQAARLCLHIECRRRQGGVQLWPAYECWRSAFWRPDAF
jgi:hypothetical protein